MRTREADRGDDLLDAARGHPDGRLRHGRPEAGRRGVRGGGGEEFAGGADEPEPVVRTPEQRLFAEPLDRARQCVGDLRIAVVTGHEGEERLVRGGVGRDRQRLRGLEREPVEVFQRPYDRCAGARPGRELAEIAGHRCQQIGPRPQQPGQGCVVAGAQGLCEGARWRAACSFRHVRLP